MISMIKNAVIVLMFENGRSPIYMTTVDDIEKCIINSFGVNENVCADLISSFMTYGDLVENLAKYLDKKPLRLNIPLRFFYPFLIVFSKIPLVSGVANKLINLHKKIEIKHLRDLRDENDSKKVLFKMLNVV